MKKVLILAQVMVLALFVHASDGPGGKANLFQLDEAQLQEEFQELNQLETYLLENETPTLANLKTDTEALAQFDLANLSEDGIASPAFSIDDMDWGAFAWGFLCCLIGFFVVGINKNKSSDSKTSYWIGVIISSVLGTISTLVSGVLAQ